MVWGKVCNQNYISLWKLTRLLFREAQKGSFFQSEVNSQQCFSDWGNWARHDFEFALWRQVADGTLSNDIHLVEGDEEKLHGVFDVREQIGNMQILREKEKVLGAVNI